MNQRGIISFFLLILIGLSICINGQALKKTVITGEIINIGDPATLPDLQMIITKKPFLSSDVWENIMIEKNGSIKVEFFQLFPHEIGCSFNEYFQLYAFPGDSIHLTIDASLLNDELSNVKNVYDYITVNCTDQEFQDEFIKFYISFHDSEVGSYTNQSNFNKVAYKDFSPFVFKDSVQGRAIQERLFLERFIQKNEISKRFSSWASGWIYARELQSLLRYTWYHVVLNELDWKLEYDPPIGYLDFLESKCYNDENLLASKEYFEFLHELYMYQSRMIQKESWGEIDSLNRAGNQIDLYQIGIKRFIASNTGFIREFLLSMYYSNIIEWKKIDMFEALYDPALIGRQDYAQVLEMEYAELMGHVLNPTYAKDLNFPETSDSDVKLIFRSLPEKYPNKVIYVDFWAPWCGPCLAEMPHSKELQEIMKGKGVIFVFLASKCTEKSWKATISQKQLSGEHYLLHDNEYSLISDKFNITGIPRYIIIDKQGIVVNDNAPRPSDETLVGLLEALCDKNETTPR